jgi:hypothetical protein
MSKPHYLKAARRIACFLDTIGLYSILPLKTSRDRYRTLMTLYSALPKELRQEARRRGRRVIKTVGLKEATRNLLPTPVTAAQRRPDPQKPAGQLSELLRLSLGHCLYCHAWGRPKRAWPNRELAEAFRPLAGDMLLVVYECPVVIGSYHLGHIREASRHWQRTHRSSERCR